MVTRFLEKVRERALGSEVAQSLTPYQQFLRILNKEMLEVFGPEALLDLSGKPPVIAMIVGLQGTGKTTSAAKLALYAKKKLKRKPLLVSVDVTRPAAIEQLERMCKEAKLDYFNSPSQKPLERAIGALKYAQTYGLDFLIIDTAGRLSIDQELMDELKVLKSELKPQVILYAVDAMSGQQGLKVAEGFSEQIGLTGAVLTKADGDSRGGVAFSIREALHIPLQFVGMGEKVDALEVFHPSRWISRILGMGDMESLFEKAEELQTEAGKPSEDEVKRLTSGELSLADFQKQMKMMSKMGSIGGLMRVTEQGEVVSLKFANRGTAQNNLEVLTASVLLHTLKSADDREQRMVPEHQSAVEDIARLSFKAYRKLAEDPGLLGYFQSASPVEELALLKIGSRPSRRFGAKGISDLRAIPWVFAWSQNRHLLTGWYGLGYAIDDFLSARGGDGLKLLRQMFLKSPGFRLAVDEVEKSLFLADMKVAELYAGLVPARTDAERIFALIRHEHARTTKVMMELSGSKMLCERFQGFRRRFDRVRPMVDQANRWQVKLLRETRESKAKDAMNMPLLMTMNCVAAGLGWTG